MALATVCIEVRDRVRSFNTSGLNDALFMSSCARIREGKMGGGLMH